MTAYTVAVLDEARAEQDDGLNTGGLERIAEFYEEVGPEEARRIHDYAYLYSGRLDLEAARSAQIRAGCVEA